LKFKIIFAHGGGLQPENYKGFDSIQHLYPTSFRDAAEFGIREEKMYLVPNCVSYAIPGESRDEIRESFGFQADDWIIICVAAWNSYQKRLDYLIDEVTALADPNAKLLLCGHPEAETAALRSLAERKLGTNVRWFTLAPEDVHRALYISNVFVLPSISEGLPSAVIEAILAELPVICHPHPGGKYILENDECLVDMSVKGELATQLRALRKEPSQSDYLKTLQQRAVDRFGAGTLAEEFYKMVASVYATAVRI
jgi:glycosyltransferase involved in cell wall biosynthesis